MCRYRTESSTKRDRPRVAIPLRGGTAKNFRHLVNAARKSNHTQRRRGAVVEGHDDVCALRKPHVPKLQNFFRGGTWRSPLRPRLRRLLSRFESIHADMAAELAFASLGMMRPLPCAIFLAYSN